MADATDPNAAPMHHEVKDKFPGWQVALAALAGITATVVGLVLGLTLVNN